MKHKQGFYEKYVKAPQDFILALCALIVLSPVLLIVAIVVRVKLGAPVLFKQERAGKNGVPYNMYKFRSMSDERDKNGELLPDEQRLGKFGKLLRSTSLEGIDIIGQTTEALILQGGCLISPNHAVVNTNWKMVCTPISS